MLILLMKEFSIEKETESISRDRDLVSGVIKGLHSAYYVYVDWCY